MILRLLCLFAIALSTQLAVFAQNEGMVWYSGTNYNGEGASNFFTFNDTGHTHEIIIPDQDEMIRDGSGKSTMADESGNLLFYSDGFDVYNRNHEVMLNGDSVLAMEGRILQRYDRPAGVNLPDWSLILPCPANAEKYYLFYMGIKDDESHPTSLVGTGLNYSKVDMQLDNGLGGVSEKNVNLLEFRSNPRNLKAIRHANGRDWWIPVREFTNSRWRVFLLDDQGVHFHHISEDNEIPEFPCRLALYNYTKDQYICMTGDHFYPWKSCRDQLCEHQFHIYDFDRCAGTFEYHRTFELETWSNKYSQKSLTLCPNGRYLYGGLGGWFIQYDTWAENVSATADTLLNVLTMDHAVSGIYEPKITPRGEMWLLHWGSDSITVFQNPELGGSDINIREEFIVTGWLNQGTFPNNANYLIGPIDGSPCDTLGIDNEPRAWFRYNDANLDKYERRFTDISYFEPETWEWDFGDGSTYHGQHPGVHEFPGNGRYRVCLTVSNKYAEDTYCEWVEIDGPSNVLEHFQDRGFALFPNPNQGQFQLQFSDNLPDEGELRVFNTMGQQLHREAISRGVDQLSVNLNHLPPGHYTILVTHDGKVDSGSIIIGR